MGSGDCPNCGAFGYCDTDCVRKVGKCANAEVTALRERVAQLEAEKAAETADTFSTAHDESPSFTPDALKDFATRNHERVNRWSRDLMTLNEDLRKQRDTEKQRADRAEAFVREVHAAVARGDHGVAMNVACIVDAILSARIDQAEETKRADEAEKRADTAEAKVKSGIAAGESATVEAIAVWLESAGTDESVVYACDLRSGEWRKP
jgi:hypothetical protein